jgi:hypothetical protein
MDRDCVRRRDARTDSAFKRHVPPEGERVALEPTEDTGAATAGAESAITAAAISEKRFMFIIPSTSAEPADL